MYPIISYQYKRQGNTRDVAFSQIEGLTANESVYGETGYLFIVVN